MAQVFSLVTDVLGSATHLFIAMLIDILNYIFGREVIPNSVGRDSHKSFSLLTRDVYHTDAWLAGYSDMMG
jgi:hypothetical protein